MLLDEEMMLGMMGTLEAAAAGEIEGHEGDFLLRRFAQEAIRKLERAADCHPRRHLRRRPVPGA